MQIIARSKVVLVALALLAGFIPLAVFINSAVLYVVVGSVLFTTSLAVLYAYWPALRVAIDYSAKELSYVDLLTMAIILVFVGTAFREMYVTFYRVLYIHGIGQGGEYFLSLSFFRYTTAIAAVMFLLARNVHPDRTYLGKVPGWPYVIVSVGVGVLFSVALVSAAMYI